MKELADSSITARIPTLAVSSTKGVTSFLIASLFSLVTFILNFFPYLTVLLSDFF